VLISLPSMAVDTVARARATSSDPSVLANPLNLIHEMPVLANDGWLAVVRIDPYRVDWRSPTGTWALGAPVAVSPVVMNAVEKAAIMQRYPTGRGAADPDTYPHWPVTLPPFTSNQTPIATQDGKLLVRRLPSAGMSEVMYDVFNRRGELVNQVAMGERERIVGFGNGTVYTVLEDSDGLQRIRRHRWR
jgi:hypothetical protein